MANDGFAIPPGRSGDHPAVFSRYSRWANGRLYDACTDLDRAEYMAERPSFFGSIHRTLNHILVADLIWLGRLQGAPVQLALDHQLHDDREGLRAAREACDDDLVAHCDALDGDWRDAHVAYANSRGDRFQTPLVQVYWHLFNHQTHHRGQVHGLLSQAGVTPPPLDLIFFLREAGA
jgi:uncharacterized damage-inducible protein DinB